jgi:hypothetical protein
LVWFCLLKNCLNRLIDKIYVFNENTYNYETNSKIENISIMTRPTYEDFIEFINLNTNENDINIIANSDIYFNETLSIINQINMDNTCISLTRWDINEDWNKIFFNRSDSQDCWIFKGKIKDELKSMSNFYKITISFFINII